jgi:hypothetical protein
MHSQGQVKLLRHHLLAKARLAQRALDYSIKGYSLRSSDFSRSAHLGDHEGEEQHHRVKELCRELMSRGIAHSSDAHFVFAALGISSALHAAQSAAVGIAQDTSRLLESTGIQACGALEAAGRHVNAAMRVAVIALFARDVSHAHAVLRYKPWLQLRELSSVALHPHIGRWAGGQGDFERSIIRNLTEVAKQTHEIADAILFWLDGDSYKAACASGGSPSAREETEAAALTYISTGRAPIRRMPQGVSC